LEDQPTSQIEVGSDREFQDILEELDREEAVIDISVEHRQYSKTTTVIRGLGLNEREMRELCTRLKKNLAAGGTVKDGVILIQGDHRDVIKEVMKNNGFLPERIRVG
jgi:translation initiation factor 1